MVKPALAANRAVVVLDFLALHPGRAFSLKELSTACGVNGASLLAVVTALVDGGYLLRHPNHKTYTIGPGVVSLAHAALVQHPTIDAARRELPMLADDLEAHCSASVRMGDTLVAVAMAGSARRAATWTQPGMRLPFSAPVRRSLRRVRQPTRSGNPGSDPHDPARGAASRASSGRSKTSASGDTA